MTAPWTCLRCGWTGDMKPAYGLCPLCLVNSDEEDVRVYSSKELANHDQWHLREWETGVAGWGRP